MLYSRKFKDSVKIAKSAYRNSILESLSRVRGTREFWQTVKNFDNRKGKHSLINAQGWENFYKGVFPARLSLTVDYYSVFHPQLDSDFSTRELNNCLKKLKNNKAPGLDKITNNILKGLPAAWEHYLLNLCNTVMNTESVPGDWSLAEMCMLHKSGDENNPFNYRGIALLNTVTKVFTSMLARRVML